MKKTVCLFAFLALAPVALAAAPFKSPCINGATGLIGTPTAHTGWTDSQFGADFGVRYIKDGGENSTVPTATVQLFRMLELGAAFDMQDERGDDLLFNGKINFYNAGSSAVAIGGNYQRIEWNDDDDTHEYYQLYLAATYGGSFFGMPAETTLVFGRSDSVDHEDEVYNNEDNDFDFSMGFDLDLLPSIFKGYVHLISDFSNYSYSMQPTNADHWYRGVFNTGARIAVFKDSRRYKLNVDAVVTDVLDNNRDFALGAVFGLSF